MEQGVVTPAANDEESKAKSTHSRPTVEALPTLLEPPQTSGNTLSIPNGLTPPGPLRWNPDSSSPRGPDRNGSPLTPSRSNSKNSTIGDSLKERLRVSRVECTRDSHSFIVPECAQKELITEATVAKEIQAGDPSIRHTEAGEYARKTCQSARQLFAILAYMKKGWEVCSLLEEGITNEDLPLKRGDMEGFALQRKNGTPIKTLEGWDPKDREKFHRIQWWMIAPVFKSEEHHELDDNTILPFIPFEHNAEAHEPKQGGYSEVYPVRIHRAHHKFWERPESENDEPFVAIKKLFSSDEEEFLKEVTVLKQLGPKKNPHLIKLLATYQQRQKYHLMFPYADANLRKYWEDRRLPNFDKATVLWSLKQMKGISHALTEIHTYRVTYRLSPGGAGHVREQGSARLSVGKGEELYGRHGDIKPENILWFKQTPEVKDEMGVLQIADFGLGRFHGRDSRSRINPDTVRGSPTYEPPECKLRSPVSRAYDIWSLGCLYLEFITWLLKGSAEIETFSNHRGRETPSTGINDDNFFTIITDPMNSAAPQAEVREGVTTWAADLHRHEKCSNLIHDLLDLTMESLLVIESKDRIDASRLHQKLKALLKDGTKDEKYLLEPAPRLENPERSTSLPTLPRITVSGPERNTVTRNAPPRAPRDLVQRTAGTPGLLRGVSTTWPQSKR